MSMRTCGLVALASCAIGSTASLAQGTITVGKNVQVSLDRPNMSHEEVMIAADPQNPKIMLVCSMAYPSERSRAFDILYRSEDGGVSWRPAIDLFKPSADDLGEPWFVDIDCAFGPDGHAYFVAMKSRPPDVGPTEAWVFHSPDRGSTWSSPATVPHAGDRPYIAIDHTSGPYRGRVYLTYYAPFRSLDRDMSRVLEPSGGSVSLEVSLDSGRHFSLTTERFTTPGSDYRYPAPAAQNVVLSDGTLLVPIHIAKGNNYDEASLRLSRSTDGGRTLSSTTVVADMQMARMPAGMSWIPFLTADHGSVTFKDHLYAVWADRRSGRLQIMFTNSTDKGLTWTKPRIIGDDTASAGSRSPNNIQPAVAVNKDGVVGVSWFDRRDTQDGIAYFVRFAASLDGGETWLPSVRVSEAPSQFERDEAWVFSASRTNAGSLTVARNFRPYLGGHHAGITADAGGVFHPVWTDNRTGVAQAWTAPVTVTGRVSAHGGGGLEGLKVVTNRVALEMIRTQRDKLGNAFTVAVRLRNISPDTVRGPVFLRALEFSSDFGALKALNADNHAGGPGAVWDFSGTLTKGQLPPGQFSAARDLSFVLSRPTRSSSDSLRSAVVNLNGVVLARDDH